jgi:hypothetical protein
MDKDIERKMLTPADMVPVEESFLATAQTMLPPTVEDEVIQIRRHQALALFLQKCDHNLRVNAQSPSSEASTLLEQFIDEVRTRVISEEDFVARLVGEMDAAQTAIDGEKGMPQKFWQRIFQRREQRIAQRAHQLEAEEARQRRQEELQELRNATFESEWPRIEMADLKVGDSVLFSSLANINQSDVFSLQIVGKIIGTDKDERGPVILIKIDREERKNDYTYMEQDTAKHEGIVVRFIGTANNSDEPTSKIAQNQPLIFLTTEGKPVTHGKLKYHDRNIKFPNSSIVKESARLDQLTINGVEVFPPQKWSYMYGQRQRVKT